MHIVSNIDEQQDLFWNNLENLFLLYFLCAENVHLFIELPNRFFFSKENGHFLWPFLFSKWNAQLKHLQVIPWLWVPVEDTMEREVMQCCARPSCGHSALTVTNTLPR